MTAAIIEIEVEKMEKAFQRLLQEFSGLRTGRAHPSLMDPIKVDVYGQSNPLKNVASVTVNDAKTITIMVWDVNNIKAVEAAIRNSSLGVNPRVDGATIYITLQELTEERRHEMVKIIKKKSEDSKIAIRNIRRDANDKSKKMEKDKEISEDQLNDLLDEIQKNTDLYISKIESTTEKKIIETKTI